MYNVEKFLPRCIDSILSQSFTDFELILVNDGSPDNCGNICDEYAVMDNRVRVFHKSNGGVSSARNFGLDNARGEWITFVDSDDYIGKSYLSEFYTAVNRYSADLVVINNQCSYEEHQTVKVILRDDYDTLFSVDSMHRVCAPWGKLFHASIIRDLNLKFDQELSLGEDVVFVLSYLLGISKLVQIKSDSYCYELREGSLTKKENSYEFESTTSEKFSLLINPIIDKFNLGAQSVRNLRIWQVLFTERVINAIMRIPTPSERIGKLNGLDYSVYRQYKEPISLKERVIVFLLKNRFFRIYERLMRKR